MTPLKKKHLYFDLMASDKISAILLAYYLLKSFVIRIAYHASRACATRWEVDVGQFEARSVRCHVHIVCELRFMFLFFFNISGFRAFM